LVAAALVAAERERPLSGDPAGRGRDRAGPAPRGAG